MPAHIEMSTNSPSFVFSEGVGLALFIIISTLWKIGYQKLHEGERHGYDKLVGQTPLLELRNISGLLGRKIFVKVSLLRHLIISSY